MPETLSNSVVTTQPENRVFVVVPSYNHARFVEKCLRSIFKQTFPPSELVVIDDGSTDDSPEIIANVLKDCPFPCELVVRPNRGLSATLNEGLKRSRGNYFAYLGSDDVWLPKFLETRVSTLERRPSAVLAYGNAYSIDGENAIFDCTTDWASYVDGDARRMLMETLAPLSPTVVYRRGALLRHGWNEDARLEDYELYLRLSGDGDFAFDPQVLSGWRIHGDNTSLDLTMMMNEKLEAQRRVGVDLGFSKRELEKFLSIAVFRSAQEYRRRNEKLLALRLMLGNLRGIQTPGEAARMLAGLLAPHKLFHWRRSRQQEKASQRYDSIKI